MNNKQDISLVINGRLITANVSANLSIADFLHETLNLTGTKVSCAIGLCKSCTVAVRPIEKTDYFRMLACITPVATLNNYSLLTVEGLESNQSLSPLQQAFLKHFSFQCGYCAPGFLMGATLLIEELKNKPVSKAEIDHAIAESLGEHVCRCTGYVKYYQGIKEVILSMPGLTY